MSTTELVFVRHGETRSNIEQLLHGRTDEPLNALGKRQAQRVAERLGASRDLDLIYSSPLARARVTAESIAKQIGIDARIHPGLAEYHFGDFEGFTINRIKDEHPKIYQGMFDFADLAFRFPNGESRGEFHERVLRAVSEIKESHREKRIVVVAHEGVIVSAVHQLTGGDPNDWTKYRIANCSITRVECNGDEIAEITCWNDTLHLLDEGDVP
jgi:broad specificity phosphatase PhoE